MVDLTKLRPLKKVPLDEFGAPGECVFVRSLSRAEINQATAGEDPPWEQNCRLLSLAICDGNGVQTHTPEQVNDIPIALVEVLLDRATNFSAEAAKKK